MDPWVFKEQCKIYICTVNKLFSHVLILWQVVSPCLNLTSDLQKWKFEWQNYTKHRKKDEIWRKATFTCNIRSWHFEALLLAAQRLLKMCRTQFFLVCKTSNILWPLTCMKFKGSKCTVCGLLTIKSDSFTKQWLVVAPQAGLAQDCITVGCLCYYLWPPCTTLCSSSWLLL